VTFRTNDTVMVSIKYCVGDILFLMTANEALEWIAELFEEPVENITAETPRDEIPAWDSLGILTLMARLDEDFEILLEEEEVQELRSVGDILDALRRHGKLD
jgi:acyl carrier protein